MAGADGVGSSAKARGLWVRPNWRAEPICAPHLIDAEIAHVLRKHVLAKRISEARAQAALRDFLDMRLVRFAHTRLLLRVFELRDTMTSYDTLYVALAESLDATLVTRDARSARAAEGVARWRWFS